MEYNNAITEYKKRITQFEKILSDLKSQSRLYSWGRFLIFVLMALVSYLGFQGQNIGWLFLLLLLGIFLVLVRFHDKIKQKIHIRQNLIDINRDEINFLERNEMPFADGKEFIDTGHFYSYDLDIFGSKSLFQHLNRTHTGAGTQRLADDLLTLYPIPDIIQRQEAVKELSDNLDWRQEFSAIAKYISDSKEGADFLTDWGKRKINHISRFTLILSYLLAAIFIGTFIYWIINPGSTAVYGVIFLYLLNLGFFAIQLKKIEPEIKESDRIDEIISGYSLLLDKIESTDFQSERLNNLKTEITSGNQNASRELNRLSRLLAELNGVENFLVKLLLDGTVFYHLHRFVAFNKWKSEFGFKLEDWLKVIGEFEALNTLANFAYNNPDYSFPQLNEEYKISFTNLGHPLIRPDKRVCNDISFEDYPFGILTGSNMSGKSTFLRTLGVNMILSGCGSVVCADSAIVSPLPVLVSMRQSDSLAEDESYFFAEVKRLKTLMDELTRRKSFILLDEILRGTNSDDKQSGTIGVIRKIVKNHAIGMIATHDKEVCKTADEFPDKIVNLNFEVEIKDDELQFDYKLRKGICKNKSATFLMNKMGIIDEGSLE